MRNLVDIQVDANVELTMRERGKRVDHRQYHNVFTSVGANWLSRLCAWSSIGAVDVPYTNRRVRWVGVGGGAQLEVPSVVQLVQPLPVLGANYLTAIQSVEFPTSTSVTFIREFSLSEITLTATPVIIREVAMFADVVPANMGGTQDQGFDLDPSHSTLNPETPTNPPICYKSFEGMTKTQDFTFTTKWTFRY